MCVSKDSWDIKLIDFGLAQELVPGVRMKALKGTPEFMGMYKVYKLLTYVNWIIAQRNFTDLIALAIMVYEPLYHAREIATIKLASGCSCKAK